MLSDSQLIGDKPVVPPSLVRVTQTGKIISPGAPLIRIPRVKWMRDSGIGDMIEYLDEPGREGKWDELKVAEIQQIQIITEKCRKDFTYAARNFFWITNKDRGEQLFRLWESQELIYEHMVRMKARGVAQKLMILKARQLGCSTLIEALIAWRTMFFKNVNAIVVSFDPDHAAYLFGIMQYIYDRMPWWLKPMCASREFKNGLWFENPDASLRRQQPGLCSRVKAEAANKRSGVGQGVRISAAHFSEYSGCNPDDARDVIEEDLGNALAENPETFAILESTAKGAGSYSHKLWKKNVQLGESADWLPLFFPWFFEKTRTRKPISGWRPRQADLDMRVRVESDWTRCNNVECLQYHERFSNLEDTDGSMCPTCEDGILKIYTLSDAQLYWMYVRKTNAEKDAESLKKLLQEMSTTSESAWQLSGIQVFPDKALAFVERCIEEPKGVGFLDKNGKFHGCNPASQKYHDAIDGHTWHQCFVDQCRADHTGGDSNGEHPVSVWRFPEPGAEYVCGGDISEGGGGDADYSIGFMLRKGGAGQDEQVARFKSNTTDPITFAYMLNSFGRWYNDAMMAPEVNRYDTTLTILRMQCNYPNLYRWKHMDSMNIMSNKLGWFTQQNSKPRLYQTWSRKCQDRLMVVHSRDCYEEMKTFQKEDQETRATGASEGEHDDELIAGMIALYTGREGEWDDNLGQISFKQAMTMENSEWHVYCMTCENTWPSSNPSREKQCIVPDCGSRMLTIKKNADYSSPQKENPEDDLMAIPEVETQPDGSEFPSYEAL